MWLSLLNSRFRCYFKNFLIDRKNWPILTGMETFGLFDISFLQLVASSNAIFALKAGFASLRTRMRGGLSVLIYFLCTQAMVQ